MNIKRHFISAILVFLGLCLPLSSVFAVACSSPKTGNVELTESCTFGGNYDGAAEGNIVVGTNVTLTILAGQTINVSQGYSYTITASGAKIVIIDTGAIQISDSILCLVDADGDTYPASLDAGTQTLATGSCGAGKIARKDAMAQVDCNDGNVSYFAALTCYPDADSDTYYSTTSHSVCGGATCAGVGESTTAGTDCDDSTNAKYAMIQCYANADNDGVYSKTLGTAFCGSTCAAAGQSATIGTDCCDTDANAKPGQAGWFAVARSGCGGFDYNCDGVEAHNITSGSGGCGSCSNNTTTQSCSWAGASSGWTGADPGCGNTATTRQAGMCNEMLNYPNCAITGCATFSTTQTCQ